MLQSDRDAMYLRNEVLLLPHYLDKDVENGRRTNAVSVGDCFGKIALDNSSKKKCILRSFKSRTGLAA